MSEHCPWLANYPDGVPRSHYERLRYFARDGVRLEDYR